MTITSLHVAPPPSSNPSLHNTNKSSPHPSRAVSPSSSESITGRHLIYRGIKKKSMEYMSIAHSTQHPCLAHTLKGEILISGLDQPGYIQYCFSFDKDWMTRRVSLTAMFDGGLEKRLTLEVDRNRRWFKVIEHRLIRSRSFFRSGVTNLTDTHHQRHIDGMQDADTATFSDAGSCCSASPLSPSSAADLEEQDTVCSIPFEKINLTWTPPPKGTKRGSKRFSSINPLKDVLAQSPTPTNPSPVDLAQAMSSGGTPCATMTNSTTIISPLSPPSLTRFAKTSPDLFTRSPATGEQTSGATTTYEHLPWLDGCIDLDMGSDFSPSTLLPSLRRATLGIDPDQIDAHLEGLIANPSAITSERMVVVSFPDLELRPVWTHVAYVGKGQEGLSIVEVWTEEEDEDKDGTLVEVDSDGLVVRYGDTFGRIPLET
ncbi:hypothetical protein FBU30_006563 [Linnemannia zychae]|nr:hypothetical protein FBU30_006563 [Linnemannia zychae]